MFSKLLRILVIKINCDLCGKTEETLARTLVEGVEIDVCSACSKFGKVIRAVSRPSPKEQHKQVMHRHIMQEQKEEKIEMIVEDYSLIIKNKRESLGMTQKDFASRINEKESTVHKMETGHMEPPIDLARKLEKILGVKLVGQHEEKHEQIKKGKEGGFTLGDFIKVRKKQ
ncbi:MAG: multiprotein bridging factor aMBF1 [Nanoarchaeota archaeon]